METNKKNNRLIFNFILLATVAVLFSSCAREKASWSYHNEKLRKQSLEIENSMPAGSLSMENPGETAIVASEENTVPLSVIAPEKNTFSTPADVKNTESKKLNPVQKLALKKLSKKLSPEKLEKAKKGGMDQNLRYAIIFGVIGVALCILGWVLWPLYFLGVISIVVGLVFLVLWIMEQ